MSDTIFDADDKSVVTPEVNEQTSSPEPVVQAADYSGLLSTIKNEDGSPKYASVEDALNSITHAQQHISSIEADNAKLREEKDQYTSAAELLKSAQNAPEPTSPAQPSVSTEDVATLVEKAIEGRESAKTAQANQATVVKALSDKFGEKAEEAYEAKAKSLNISVGVLNDLSARSPDAVLAYFPEVANAPSKSSSEFSTEAFQSPHNANEADMGVLKKAGGPCTTNDSIAAWREAGKLVDT